MCCARAAAYLFSSIHFYFHPLSPSLSATHTRTRATYLSSSTREGILLLLLRRRHRRHRPRHLGPVGARIKVVPPFPGVPRRPPPWRQGRRRRARGGRGRRQRPGRPTPRSVLIPARWPRRLARRPPGGRDGFPSRRARGGPPRRPGRRGGRHGRQRLGRRARLARRALRRRRQRVRRRREGSHVGGHAPVSGQPVDGPVGAGPRLVADPPANVAPVLVPGRVPPQAVVEVHAGL